MGATYLTLASCALTSAYREPDRKPGRELMQQLIGPVGHSVPTSLREVVTLGRTSTASRGRAGLLDRPGTSNGGPRRLTAASNTSAAQPRLPQPHQLHHQISSGDRVQAPTTPSIMKSR
jgi:hypothetical protein